MTKGPWVAIPYQYILNQPKRARIHGADNSPVVDDCNPSMDDAQLIAAAPDLLDACELALDDFEMEGIELNHDTVSALRAAINKARGQA